MYIMEQKYSKTFRDQIALNEIEYTNLTNLRDDIIM